MLSSGEKPVNGFCMQKLSFENAITKSELQIIHLVGISCAGYFINYLFFHKYISHNSKTELFPPHPFFLIFMQTIIKF